MKEIFENIYRFDLWGGGSGEGSRLLHCRPYVEFLQKFLKEKNIGSVVDFGCGDWQLSSHIDWNGVDYKGYDIVDKVIDTNRRQFTTPHIEFHPTPADYDELPSADLLLVKDVLQHWSFATIQEFIPVFNRYKYVLVTNCIGTVENAINIDIHDGEFRPLDISKAPFNVNAHELLQFTNYRAFPLRFFLSPRWVKKVLLVQSQNESLHQ